MAEGITNSAYAVHLTRRPGECVASIPELCISETEATPQEALASALLVEADMRRRIEAEGGALPPVARPAGGIAGIGGAARRHWAFARQVAFGYAIVACISIILLALVLPSAHSRVEQYLVGTEAAADARKIFTRLGIAACLPNP